MLQNFIIPKLSKIGLATIGPQSRLDETGENVKFALQTTWFMSIIICLHVTF